MPKKIPQNHSGVLGGLELTEQPKIQYQQQDPRFTNGNRIFVGPAGLAPADFSDSGSMTVEFEPVLLIRIFIILIAVLIDFVGPAVYNNKKEQQMNLLFERVRIQAQISRLYDLVGPEQADQIVETAWQIERTRSAKTLEQRLKESADSQHVLAR